MKRVITIQDPAVPAAATAILSALGNRVYAFSSSYAADTTALDGHCDAIYVPFPSNGLQLDTVRSVLRHFGAGTDVFVIDPSMVHGGIVNAFIKSPTIRTELRLIVDRASIITPNFQDAQVLLNRPVTDAVPTTKELSSLCQDLIALGPSQVVITGIPTDTDEIKIVSADKTTASFDEIKTSRFPLKGHGVKDVFVSVFIGAVLRGAGVHKAAHMATTFVHDAILYTYQQAGDDADSIWFEPCIHQLLDTFTI